MNPIDHQLSYSARPKQMLLHLLVVLPWLSLLPLWLSPAWLLVFLYRYIGWRRGWPRLSSWGAVVAIAIFLVVIATTYGRSWSVEAASAFLVGVYVLKLLESETQRDARVLLALGLLVIGVGFLFHQGIAYSLFALILVILHLYLAHVLVMPVAEPLRPGRFTRMLVPHLLMLALPLTLVLFLLFPRLPPLWRMPLASNQFVGLAEDISLTDMQDLARNPDVAFRVQFDGPLAQASSQYWRAMTLNYFDGQRWRDLAPGQSWPAVQPDLDQVLSAYDLTLPATGQSLLFSLDYPGQAGRDQRLLADFSLRSTGPVLRPTTYRQQQFALNYTPEDTRVLTYAQQLPAGNARTAALAKELTQGLEQPSDKLERLQHWFLSQAFFYSLQAPALGRDDQIDRFLFDTQIGFCSHYAAALVILLRHAGVQARMVTGYLGGELSGSGDYWVVRQYDAHAWVEYYQPDKGWVRVDPTAWIAPDRVLSRPQDLLPDEANLFRQNPWQNSNLGLLVRTGWWLDNLDYQWQRRVMNFDQQDQAHLMQGLSRWWQAWVSIWWQSLLSLGLMAGLMIIGWQGLCYYRQPASMRQWLKLKAWLKKQGFEIQEKDSIALMLARLPDPEAHACARQWQAWRYDQQAPGNLAEQLAALRQRLQRQGLADIAQTEAVDAKIHNAR